MSNARVADIYPLSPTQRGMLFHSLYAPGSGVYVVQLGFTLEETIAGAFNAAAFDTAWQQLALRHDALRTAFAWDKLDAPLAVVGAQVQMPCTFSDLTHLDDAAQHIAIDEWLLADRSNGFTLSAAPLLRVHRFQLSTQRHRVICSYHHILFDGWSLPLLLRDWRQLYLAASRHETAVMSPAPRFRDYVAWLKAQDRNAGLAFWREQLRGFTTPNAIGSDTGKTATPDMKAQQLLLPVELSQALTKLAANTQVTLSTLIQGAWALLAGCYSGSDDVVFGVTRAGRPAALPAVGNTVGMLITTLPQRAHIDAGKSLDTWLRGLQSSQLAQQPYEHIALAELRGVSEIPAQQQLFDSIVVFENYPLQQTGGVNDPLQLRDVSVSEQTHYGLSLFAVAGDQLELRLLFDAARFSDTTIENMLARLQYLLQQFCDQPQQLLSSIDTLLPAEQALIDNGNRTACPVPQHCIHDSIAQQAARAPHAIAIRDVNGVTDYATLVQRSATLASQLRDLGIGKGQRVGICVTRTADMVVAMLGVMQSGAAYVPLDASYPQARLQHMLDDSGATAVIAQTATRTALTFWQGSIVDIDGFFALTPALSRSERAPEQIACASSSEDIAYVIYTSGSSGLPKGVALTHRNLANLLQAMQTRSGFDSNDRWLAVTTLSFDIAALELLLPLLAGGELVIADEHAVRDAERLIALLTDNAISYLQATPSTWRLLVAAGWNGNDNLTMLCGGEALDSMLAQQLLQRGKTLWNVYGPTETTIWSGALALTQQLLQGATAPIGNALANNSFHVLDAHGRPVPIGVAGEMHIGGAGVAVGYHNRAELTAQKFIANPLATGNDTTLTHSAMLYRTGDRVRLRADGNVDYLGRFDHQTKLRGYRIELEEIDNVLRTQSGVTQAAAVIHGEGAGARLVAFISADEKISDDDIRAHAASQLPAYMVPALLHRLDALPLTPNGKIDRPALRELRPATATAAAALPSTALEQALLQIWREALGHDRVGVHDNFFDAGGHSLLIVNIASKLRQQLQVDVALVDLFRHSTIATLARHIDTLRSNGTQSHTATHSRSAQLDAGRQRMMQRRQQGTRPVTAES